MITVGSGSPSLSAVHVGLRGGEGTVPVRGNEMFCTPLRAIHAGRSSDGPSGDVCSALSNGGHVRFAPACTERVRAPQAAQNWLRLFQSRRLRAWARIAAVFGGDSSAQRERRKEKEKREGGIPSDGMRSRSSRACRKWVPSDVVAASATASAMELYCGRGVTSSAKYGCPVYVTPSRANWNASDTFSSRPRKTSVGVSVRESKFSISFASSRSKGVPMSAETLG